MATAMATLALAAGSAWGSTASSVSVTGPRKVQAGQKVKLYFTGYAATGVTRLGVWLDNRRCASSARAEEGRSGLRAPTYFQVQGKFRARLTVDHSQSGPHVVCAYLIGQRMQDTAARASWRYVTS